MINHCVTNYYRNNDDFIQHHNDKTLDLNYNGVILSVTLGSSERIFELKRKCTPCDVFRIRLPHNSMVILGPYTNREFTHSIIKQDCKDDSGERISLTFREVTTFLDVGCSGRIFGQGSALSLRTLDDVRRNYRFENRIILCLSMLLSGNIALLIDKKHAQLEGSVKDRNAIVLFTSFTVTLSMAASYVLRYMRNVFYKRLEERMARKFFTSTSVTGSKY